MKEIVTEAMEGARALGVREGRLEAASIILDMYASAGLLPPACDRLIRELYKVVLAGAKRSTGDES